MTGQLLVLALMSIVVAALLIFANRLHDLTNAHKEQIDRLQATVDRMEAASKVVAENLASSISRADAADGPEGAAADAALRTGNTPL